MNAEKQILRSISLITTTNTTHELVQDERFVRYGYTSNHLTRHRSAAAPPHEHMRFTATNNSTLNFISLT